MIQIAVVEDNKEQAATLESYIRAYAAEYLSLINISEPTRR